MANSPVSGAPALTFTFSAQTLRVILRDGEPWFVAADLLETLTLDRKALERLDDDEKGVNTIHTPGGQQEMTVINESGLYSLILTSRKPEAKKFKKWVTSEVLPAIRKTGRYVAPAAAPVRTAELLTGGQLQAIRRVIWFITRGVRNEGTWVQAVWFYLRRAVALPSPYAFNVDHVPRLQQELSHMLAVSRAVRDITDTVENEAARRIFRKGEDAAVVLAELRTQADKDMADLDRALLTVPDWLRQDIHAIADRRTPYVEGLNYNEPENTNFGTQGVTK